jgi:hypothetical protein
MVLISINPFGLRKTFLLAAALLGLSSALCFADPLFVSSRFALPEHRWHRGALSTVESSTASSARFHEDAAGSGTNWLTCNPE